MTLISADNPIFTTIHGDFFNYLSTANKESGERCEIIFNDEPSQLESLSHTAIRQSNTFSISVIANRVLGLPQPEYHYNYRYENTSVVVMRLFVEQSNEFTISAENDILLQGMLSEIDDLLKNEYDWDEIDYIKPTPEDIDYAKFVLREFVFTISSKGYSLKKPYISNFEEGGASIKWKIGDRTLYLEIGENISVFSKVWRESDGTRVIERPLSNTDYLQLWNWIIDEE